MRRQCLSEVESTGEELVQPRRNWLGFYLSNQLTLYGKIFSAQMIGCHKRSCRLSNGAEVVFREFWIK